MSGGRPRGSSKLAGEQRYISVRMPIKLACALTKRAKTLSQTHGKFVSKSDVLRTAISRYLKEETK